MSELIKKISEKLKTWIEKLKNIHINHNLVVYLFMVFLATLFWLFNKSGSTIETMATFRIEYFGLPQNITLVPGITTNEIRVNFSARGTTLLHHGTPNFPIKIDISKLNLRTFPESDTTIKYITNDDIRQTVEAQLPNDYHFISLSPDTLKLDYGISSRKKVPIILKHNIECDGQYRLSNPPIIQPDSAIVFGTAIIVDTLQNITTETLQISKLNKSKLERIKLVTPLGVNSTPTYAEVMLNVEKFTQQTIELPITQLNVPDSIQLRIFTQNATLKFNVGWKNYPKITDEMFSVAVDYKDLTGIVRPKSLPLKITKMPNDKGITYLKIYPEQVEYLIEKKVKD